MRGAAPTRRVTPSIRAALEDAAFPGGYQRLARNIVSASSRIEAESRARLASHETVDSGHNREAGSVSNFLRAGEAASGRRGG
jgi:hypothetical protein